MLAVCKYGMDGTAGWYYGYLVYSFQSWKKERRKNYGNGCVDVTVQYFEKWAMEKNKRETEKWKQAWYLGFPVPFGGIRFLNDMKNFSGEIAPTVRDIYINTVVPGPFSEAFKTI